MMHLASVPLLLSVSIRGNELLAHEVVEVLTANGDPLELCAKDGMNNCPAGVGEHALLQAKGQISRLSRWGNSISDLCEAEKVVGPYICKQSVPCPDDYYTCKDITDWYSASNRHYKHDCYATEGYQCKEITYTSGPGTSQFGLCKETPPDTGNYKCLPPVCGWAYSTYTPEAKYNVRCDETDMLKKNPQPLEKKTNSGLYGNWVKKGELNFDDCARACGDEDCMLFSRPVGKTKAEVASCWTSVYGGYPGSDNGEDVWVVNLSRLPATKLIDQKCLKGTYKYQGRMTWLQCLYKCEKEGREGCSYFSMDSNSHMSKRCWTSQLAFLPDAEPCGEDLYKNCYFGDKTGCRKRLTPP